MGPPHEGSIRRPIAPWANALTTELRPAPVFPRDTLIDHNTARWQLDGKQHHEEEKEKGVQFLQAKTAWERAQSFDVVFVGKQV